MIQHPYATHKIYNLHTAIYHPWEIASTIKSHLHTANDHLVLRSKANLQKKLFEIFIFIWDFI